MKKIVFVFSLTFLFSITGFSQSDVVEFLSSGKDDATTLVKAYLNPYATALSEGRNNTWYNTAEVHSFLGFDLQVNVSAVNIPTADKTFDVNALDLNNVAVAEGSSSITPTVAGKNETGSALEVYLDPGIEDSKISFNAPSGTGLDILPVPMVQVGLGVGFNTEIIGRFVPEQNGLSGDDFRVGLYGVGIKHNFKEWIPVLKRLPFDASVFAGYSKIYAQSDVSFGLDDYGLSAETYNYEQDENQMLDVNAKAMKIGLVLSKKVSILTVYASVSENTSKLDIDLKGRYPFLSYDGGEIEVQDEVDPVSIQFKTSHLALDAGVRLKLGFISFSGSISKSTYTSYNAGIGIGFR